MDISVTNEIIGDQRKLRHNMGCIPGSKMNIIDKLDVENKADAVYEPKFKDIYPQVIASTVASFFTIQSGITMVYSNLLLHSMDIEQVSWFASVGIITTPLGAIISGPLSDLIGRRNFHILIGIPGVISWVLLSGSDITQFHMLIIARFLAGICGGMCTATLVYSAEITHKNYRGMLLSFINVYVSLGILITTVMGTFFDWQQTAYIFAVLFFIINVVTILYLPESPYWLMNFGPKSPSKARQMLKKLNPNDQVEEKEWEAIVEDCNIRKYNKSHGQKSRWTFTDPAVYKPSIILTMLLLLQQMSGVYWSLSYAKGIISLINASKSTEDDFIRLLFLILGVSRFVVSVITMIVSKYLGRKPILISSTGSLAVLCLALFVLLRFFLNDTNNDNNDGNHSNNGETAAIIVIIRWTALILFLCYLSVNSFGISTVPWTLIPELLPVPFKSVGTSLLISYTYLLYFVGTKILPYVLETIPLAYVFLFFGTFNVSMTVFAYLYMPETFGKSVVEINEYFVKPNYSTIVDKCDNDNEQTSSCPLR